MSKLSDALDENNLVDYVSRYVSLKPDGNEFKGLCPFHDEKTPSFTVFPAKGGKHRYHCFGCGESGDAIDFAMEFHGISIQEAIAQLSGERQPLRPIHPEASRHRSKVKPVDDPYKDYKPMIPVPRIRENEKIKARRATPAITNPKRKHIQRSVTPDWVYPYYSADGKLICYVMRIDLDDKRKITPTITYCEKPDGDYGWVYMRPPKKWHQPYNAHTIAKNRKAPVLIVEGEKCADIAGQLLSAYVPTTWLGGTNAVDKTDWSCMAGRKVLIIPDNDEPGFKAARALQQKLIEVGAAEIKCFQGDGDKPKGWDIADAYSEGMKPSEYIEYLRPRVERILDDAFEENKPPHNSPSIPTATNGPVLEPRKYTGVDIMGPPPTIPWRDQNSKGRPLTTFPNFLQILDAYGVNLKYNAMSKRAELTIPGTTIGVDNYNNVAISHLISACHALEYNIGNVKDYILTEADRHTYHPAHFWVTAREWDGEDRLVKLAESMQPKDMELAYTLLRRWLISGVAALYEERGVAAQGCLVLVGDQYTGKTSWLKKLVGPHPEFFYEGAMLNFSDKDSIIQAVQFWIVELGELDATFRKSDIAALKAFITKDNDKFRRPYAAEESEYPRRTIFAGTVNNERYLQDETGNRRYWTVHCTDRLDINHGLDMQQVWAQAKHLYDSGENWALDLDEMKRLNKSNRDYEEVDPIEELLLREYDPSVTHRTRWMTCAEILITLGYDRPNRGQARALAPAVKKHFGLPTKKTGKICYLMPERNLRVD